MGNKGAGFTIVPQIGISVCDCDLNLLKQTLVFSLSETTKQDGDVLN